MESKQFIKVQESDYDFNEVTFLDALQLHLSNN